MQSKINRIIRKILNMKTYENTTPKYAHEFFKLIEKSDDRTSKLKEYGVKPPLNYLLAMNFDDRVEFDLPSGPPPMGKPKEDHPDLYAPLAGSVKRLLACLKSDTRIPRFKKEHVFLELIENCNTEEANVLVFAKDKSLTELYPWLTAEFVKSVFPDYVHTHSTRKDRSEQ